MDVDYVLCEVGGQFLCVVYMNSSLQRVNLVMVQMPGRYHSNLFASSYPLNIYCHFIHVILEHITYVVQITASSTYNK
jgi:hypothetical protein